MRNKINAFNSTSGLFCSIKLSKISLLGLLLCFGFVVLNVSAAPWSLDPTFGSGGKVVLDMPVGAQGMALQPDGKIVMAGGVGSNSTSNFTIARFNADGSLDTTFDGDGTAFVSFGGTREAAASVAVQPDGKIVVAGTTYLSNYNSIAVARLNSDGSIDNTFGSGGRVTRSIDANFIPYYVSCYTVKVASDGKIVVGGGGVRQNPNSGEVSLMIRLNADGSFDNTFDTDGIFFAAQGKWRDLSIQADGSIIAAGDNTLTWLNQMKVIKISNSGGIVWNYSRGGEFQFMGLKGVAVQADGKTVAVGYLADKIIAIRLNADGTLDTTFTEAANTPTGEAISVGIQADGKIVANVVLTSGGSNGDGFSLIRYNTDGTIDTSFGNNGIVTTRVGNGNETGKRLIIQPDGKILVGGSFGNSSFVMVRYLGASAVPVKAKFDYDGDGKSDVSVFRPSESRWYILKSSDLSVIQPFFGTAGDIPVPSDFDGDGKTDIAIFRSSTGDWWYQSSINGAQIAARWGQNGDIPVPSDFDNDGKTDFVAYRPTEGKWYRLSSVGGSSVVAFGATGDKPVIGDFDGDGKSDPAIYRPSTGTWWYAASGSSNAHRAVQFGISTDVPVAADYDGDGKTDPAVYRPSQGGWHILNSGNGSYLALPFGESTDKPVAADYDGDGKVDVGVFRPSNGNWYILRSTSGFAGFQWGASTDIPTQNSFIQ